MATKEGKEKKKKKKKNWFHSGLLIPTKHLMPFCYLWIYQQRHIFAVKKGHFGKSHPYQLAEKFQICVTFFWVQCTAKSNNVLKKLKIKIGGENVEQAQTLPDATPPLGIIPPFTKIAVTFEPKKWFWCASRFRIS